MSTEIVHCPLCDNQMFIDVPSCTVCGTPNPHWRSLVEAAPGVEVREPEGSFPIEDAEGAMPVTAEASAQAEGTPNSDDTQFISPEFDLSAFFAPMQETDVTQSRSDQDPTLAPELDLSALFADFDSSDSAGEAGDPVVASSIAQDGTGDTPPVQEAPHYSVQHAEGLQGSDPAFPEYVFSPLFTQSQGFDVASEQEIIESEKPAQPVTVTLVAETAPPVAPTSDAEAAEEARFTPYPAALEAGAEPLAVSDEALPADPSLEPNAIAYLAEITPSEEFDGIEAAAVSEESEEVEDGGIESPPLAPSAEPVLAAAEVETPGLSGELTEIGVAGQLSALSVQEAMPQGVPSAPTPSAEIYVAEEVPAAPALTEPELSERLPIFDAEGYDLPLPNEQVEREDATLYGFDMAPEQSVGDLPADLQAENVLAAEDVEKTATPIKAAGEPGETTEITPSVPGALFDSEYNPDTAEIESSRRPQLEADEAFVEEHAVEAYSPTGEMSTQLDAAALEVEPQGREEIGGEAQVETSIAVELPEIVSEPQISYEVQEEQAALHEVVPASSQVEDEEGASQQPQLVSTSFDHQALLADVGDASSAPASVDELSTGAIEAPDENRADWPTQEQEPACSGYDGSDVVPATPDVSPVIADEAVDEQLEGAALQESAVTEAPSATEPEVTPYVIAPQRAVAPSSTTGAVAHAEPTYRNKQAPLTENNPGASLSAPYADVQAPAVDIPSTSTEEVVSPGFEQPEEATAPADDAPALFSPGATEYAAFSLPPAQPVDVVSHGDSLVEPREPLAEQPPAPGRVDDAEPGVASELDLSHLFEAIPDQAVIDTVAPPAEEQVAPTQAVQVVRCRVCDNQTPVGVQFCQVCGSVMPQPIFYNEVYVEEPDVEEIAPEPQQPEPQQQAAQRIFTVPVQSERTPLYRAPVWEPGMPRPKPGTPEYEAMARAALEQAHNGIAGSIPPPTPSSSQPAFAPQPTENQPPPQTPSWIPGMPRPKPGTPEYEAMARAALGQRDVSPATTPPSAPAQSPVWTSGAPRPKPGTPEYEAMARAALEQAHNGNSLPPQGSTPPGGYTPPGGQPADYFSALLPPGAPRPKPGTPEYEELVRRALNLQRGLRDEG
ncbi:MAG: hypothetical protein IVW55_02820 [Chloroflexi bacterium]|nr:hypothetical protein [Chloroflexota bacterium]